MTTKEFEDFINTHSELAGPIQKAGDVAVAEASETLGTPVEMAVIIAVFPIVSFIVKEIGLPWLYEAKRYSDLWRLKFHNWITQEQERHGLNPDQALEAGEVLRRELEAITDKQIQEVWEHLAELIKSKGNSQNSK